MRNRWTLLLLLFGVNFLLRISTLFYQIGNIDEPQTAQVAWEWMLGNPPYTTSFGDKPFFYYLFFYIILSIFGKFNLVPVHIGTTIVVTFTAWAIYLLARRGGDEKRGIVCALLFSAVTTMGDFRLIASDGESLMNLPMVLAMLVFYAGVSQVVSPGVTRRRWYFFATGLLIGLASQFRYQGGIQLAVVGSYLLLYEPFFARSRAERMALLARGILETFLILFAFLIPFAIVLGWLWWLGSWEAYSYWSWVYQADYIRDGLQTINPWKKGLIRTALTIVSGYVIWWGALETIFRSKKEEEKRLFVIGLLWLVWGYVAVTTGGRFAPRYFTQIFPPLALLAGMSFPFAIFTFQKLSGFKENFRRWSLLIPLFGFWIARFFFGPIYAMAGVYDYAHFQKEIGQYIREHTEEESRLFIWGWGNGIYIYSHCFPATRFMNADFVTGRIQGSPTAYDLNFDTSFNVRPDSWDILMEDLEKYKPVYILDTQPANIHDYIKYPIANYPRLQEYINQHYSLETTLHKVRLYRRKKD